MRVLKPHGRRAFLSGLSSVAAGAAVAPFVPLLEGHAAGDGFPKRLVLFYTPNGTMMPLWRPTGTEYDWQLSPLLEPLADVKDDIIVLDGVDNQCIYSGPGSGHQATGCLWTGIELEEGDLFTEGSMMPSGWAGGISVDQFVANRLSGETPLKSLELGVNQGNKSELRTRMSYSGPGEPVPPDSDPYSVFNRLFGDANVDPLELARRREARLSVLDSVTGDLDSLQSRLGGTDRSKVESHLDNLRNIETRIQNGGLGAGCEVPEIPQGVNNSNDNFPELGAMQLDLMTAAFACDLTRVASIFWKQETGGPTFKWEGHEESHHAISHRTDPEGIALHTEIQHFYASQFAALLQRLKAIPEGDGTMLDNTVVVWGTPISESYKHVNRNVPFILGGACGGYFETGRYLRWGSFDHNDAKNAEHGGRTNNDLLISLCHAMGQDDVEEFGNPDHCTGPLL